mgnify:FL=1
MTQFEEIYEVYFREVYLYAFALTKDREQAQEITSETFARALEGIDRFRGDCDVRYWLCRIAKNCYTSQLRKDGRLTELPEELPQEGSVEQNAIDAALSEQAQAALHALEEPYKEVFMLRVYGELSFRRIGALFGKTENWACVVFHRARNKLKERMEEPK